MEQGQAIAAFAALAHETRLEIVRYLVACGRQGAMAGEVATAVGASASRASFHLANLERAGLVEAQRASRNVIYRACFEALGAIVEYLLEDCCGGAEEIRRCCAAPS